MIERPFRLLLICALFWLAGCTTGSPSAGSAPAVQTPAAAVGTVTPVPSRPPTVPPPTETPAPAATRPSTATPTRPAASRTPAPAEPAVVPTAVFVPPAGYIDPDNFPADLNPFTGLPLPANRRNQRPLAVKISNYPPLVRPQWGLNSADLVFEHLAEGGVTRLTALFYGQEAERVGSIRSGRLIDLEIPRMVDAAFAYSGSVGPIRLRFRESPFYSRIISPDFGHGGFERIPEEGRAFEHTLFTNTYTLHFLLEQRGENRPPSLRRQMAFSREAPAGGTPARQIEIRYEGTNIYWGYQPDGTYHRWTDGQLHLDAADEKPLSASNIAVLSAHHQETTIVEDTGGHFSIEIQIWGEGPASIFRDGQRFEGRWQRLDPDDMLTLVDLQGNPLPLRPGRTYFQLVPLGFDRLLVEP